MSTSREDLSIEATRTPTEVYFNLIKKFAQEALLPSLPVDVQNIIFEFLPSSGLVPMSQLLIKESCEVWVKRDRSISQYIQELKEAIQAQLLHRKPSRCSFSDKLVNSMRTATESFEGKRKTHQFELSIGPLEPHWPGWGEGNTYRTWSVNKSYSI